MEPLNHSDYLHTQIGSLVTPVPPVAPQENCIAVFEKARSCRKHRFIPVVDGNGHPLGLVDRLHAIEELSRPFFRDLFRKKPIGDFVKPQSLIDIHQYIDELAHQITRDDFNESHDAFLVCDQGRYAGVVTFQDLLREIFERKESYLYSLAHFDPLTGLPNRVLFRDRLKQACQFAMRRQRKLAVVFIDLDGFKQINDRLGHDAGDQVLKTVATRVPRELRKVDTLSRLGGDEFTLLLPDIKNLDKVEEVTDRILRIIAQPMDFHGETMQVTGSLGAAIFPDHSESAEALIQCADLAMYLAKEKGKNNCQFYSPALRQKT